jgi:hypothetical protein
MAEDPPLYRRNRRRRVVRPTSEGGLTDRLRQTEREAQARHRDLQAAIAWLADKWRDTRCPYCHEMDWRVGTPLEVQLFPDEVMSPSFPVMCGNCGHTTLVNAVVAELRGDE